MVLEFFRRNSGEGDFGHIVSRAVTMLGDARHSYDLATLVLLSNADPGNVAQDIRDTDQRINQAEQELRSELIVHVSVKGAADIGSVLGFTLLLKKIERIGDQAKNILELAEGGVRMSGAPEIDVVRGDCGAISTFFAEAGTLLSAADVDDEAVADYAARVNAVIDDLHDKMNGYMTSDRPGRDVVPLAILYRYLRRVAANLVGIVRTSVEPLPHVDYLEGGTVDTDD